MPFPTIPTGASRPTLLGRLTSTPVVLLIVLAIVWTGIYRIYHDLPGGIALCAVGTAIGFWVRRRTVGSVVSERRSRNRELEAFRHLSQVLLSGGPLPTLFEEIARASATLLDGEAAGIGLVTEEGRFLRVVAGTGLMAHAADRLVPVESSLAGWVVQHDQPLLTQDMRRDPRNFDFPDTPDALVSAAMTPLRSGGIVIGTVSVMNRRGGHPFTPDDLNLLQALADQAALGIDRASVLDESQRSAAALAEKNAELLTATRAKDEFLANVSHELRTPLNSIIGFSDLLLSGQAGPVDEAHRQFIESVHRNGRHLLHLINTLLDVSRIDAGRMTLDLTRSDLRDAIRGAAQDTEGLRLARRQVHRFELPETPLLALADAVRVRQILFNLLANASKFTPEGGEIVLRALATEAPLPAPAERSGEQPRLVTRPAIWIAVSDNGIGIKAEDMGRLFVAFSQVDSSPSRRVQGSGLGLVLCKRFVELHGGQIGAESIPGWGSTFWFILPADGPLRRARTSGPGEEVEAAD